MELDLAIGCIVLTSPFFFEREDWIPVPRDWHRNIVQGKGYDTREPAGARLWEQVGMRLQEVADLQAQDTRVPARYHPARGDEYLVRPRVWQGGFRVEVTEAYHRRGAIAGERILPVLQAPHIKPDAESGPDDVRNGLLPRADLHILFDRGYITVTRDHRVEEIRRDLGLAQADFIPHFHTERGALRRCDTGSARGRWTTSWISFPSAHIGILTVTVGAHE